MPDESIDPLVAADIERLKKQALGEPSGQKPATQASAGESAPAAGSSMGSSMGNYGTFGGGNLLSNLGRANEEAPDPFAERLAEMNARGPHQQTPEEIDLLGLERDPKRIEKINEYIPWHLMSKEQSDIKQEYQRNRPASDVVGEAVGKIIKSAPHMAKSLGVGAFDYGMAALRKIADLGAGDVDGSSLEQDFEDPAVAAKRRNTQQSRDDTGTLFAPVNVIASTAEHIARGVKENFEGGNAFVDLINENYPSDWDGHVQSREETLQNAYDREAARARNAWYDYDNPHVLSRIIDNPASRATAAAAVRTLGPTVEDIMASLPPGQRTRENAEKIRVEQAKGAGDQIIQDLMQETEKYKQNPDAELLASFAVPGGNEFWYAEKILHGFSTARRIEKAVSRAINRETSGMSGAAKARYLERFNAETAGLQAEEKLAYIEQGPEAADALRNARLQAEAEAIQKGNVAGDVVIGAGNLAEKAGQKIQGISNSIDDAISKLPKEAQGAARRALEVTGAAGVAGAAGSAINSDNPSQGFIYGALGGAGLLAAPMVARDLIRGRRAAGGGRIDAFTAASIMPESSGWTKGLAATAEKVGVKPSSISWAARNLTDYIGRGVEMGKLAIPLGIFNNQDAVGMLDTWGEGAYLSWITGVYSHAMGKDPKVAAAENNRNDHQARITINAMSPEARANFERVGSWEAVIEQNRIAFEKEHSKVLEAEQELQQAEAARQQAVFGGGTPEQVQAAHDGIEAAQAKLSESEAKARRLAAQYHGMENATNGTRLAYKREMGHLMADIDQTYSGALTPGKTLGIELLTGEEIYQKLRAANPLLFTNATPEVEAHNDAILRDMANRRGMRMLRSGDVMLPNGQIKTSEGAIVFDPLKDALIINMDRVNQAQTAHNKPLAQLIAHEAGHAARDRQEFNEKYAGIVAYLFGHEDVDLNGEVLRKEEGALKPEELLKLFREEYLGGLKDNDFQKWCESNGLWDAENNKVNDVAAVEYMKEEVLADLIGSGFLHGINSNRFGPVAGLLDWFTTKYMAETNLGNAVREAANLSAGDYTGGETGVRFSKELVDANIRVLRAVSDLQGQMQYNNSKVTPKITKGEFTKNKKLVDHYAKDDGMFATRVRATIENSAGEKQIVDLPEGTFEGDWEHSVNPETGKAEPKRVRGFGSLPDFINVPEGGKVTIRREVIYDNNGVPVELGGANVKKTIRNREAAIRYAIDNSGDEGTPGRFRAVSEDGLTYRGKLTDAQKRAIAALPENVVPLSVKTLLFTLTDAIDRADGSRYIIDYANRYARNGSYVEFSPKHVEMVPIGLHLSKAGTWLVTTFDVSSMEEKLDRWAQHMPSRLKDWNFNKNNFVNEFANVYLRNWMEGREGWVGLDANEAKAKQKRDVFNDFLNMYNKETVHTNDDRTVLPNVKLTAEQKADEKSSNPNVLVRSRNLRHIAGIVLNPDPTAPKLPVDYGKAIYNLAGEPREAGQTPETAPQRQAKETERVLPRMGININDSELPFTAQILSGEKTIETRDNPISLKSYIGKRVGLISTKKTADDAKIVGFANIGEPIEYKDEASFRADERRHLVPAGSKYDIKPGASKWGFPLSDVEAIEPRPAPRGGIVARNISRVKFAGERPEAEEDPTMVAPGFYSKAGRVLLDKMPSKASAEQIKGILDPQKGSGVKPDELKWSGIIPHIEKLQAEKGFVSKEDIANFLKSNYAAKFEVQTFSQNDKISKYDVTYQGETETYDTYEAAKKAMDDGIRRLYSELKNDSDLYASISETGEWNIVDALSDSIIQRTRLDDGSYHRFERSYESEQEALDAIDESIQADAESMVGMREVRGQDPTTYSQYALPGGKNYEEVILRMPPVFDPSDVTYTKTEDGIQARIPNLTNYGYGPTQDAAFKMLSDRINSGQYKIRSYTSRHFQDVENYVAHMRTADHGTGRLIEELQSDLHKDARKKDENDKPIGYRERISFEAMRPKYESDIAVLNEESERLFKAYKDARKELRSMPGRRDEMSAEQIKKVDQINESTAKILNEIDVINLALHDVESEMEAHKSGKEKHYTKGISDAPFRNDYSIQLFKYALQKAVADGKEWIGWTAGEAQADRYKLASKIDALLVCREEDGWHIEGRDQGVAVFQKGITTESELEATIGKELAKKIVENQKEAGDREVYDGVDLKLGGEGMKGFYDVMLPKEIGKYVKQWGASVEKSDVVTDMAWSVRGNRDIPSDDGYTSREGAQRAIDRSETKAGEVFENPELAPIWKVAITPEMQSAVKAGQARFAGEPGEKAGSDTRFNLTEAAPKEDKEFTDIIKYGQRDTREEARLGGAGRDRDPQEAGRPSGEIRGSARLLEDAVRGTDSEAKRVRGESESRQSSRDAKHAQDAALVEAAAQHDMLLDPSDFLKRWRESGGTKGAEHLVAFDKGSPFVEKRTNIPLFHNNWSDYFDRIKIHNRYFPETEISIQGVHDQKVKPDSGEPEFLNDLNAESVLGSSALDALAMFRGGAEYTDPRRAGAYVVTRQPYVKISKTPLSQDQISDFLAERNFFKVPSYKHLEYYNPKAKVFLQDAHAGNVVSGIDANGVEKIHLIDTPFRFATEADVATIEQFNKLMRGKLMNGKISQERYAELKPFLTDPKAPEYWEGGPKFSLPNEGSPGAQSTQSINQPRFAGEPGEKAVGDLELSPLTFTPKTITDERGMFSIVIGAKPGEHGYSFRTASELRDTLKTISGQKAAVETWGELQLKKQRQLELIAKADESAKNAKKPEKAAEFEAKKAAYAEKIALLDTQIEEMRSQFPEKMQNMSPEDAAWKAQVKKLNRSFEEMSLKATPAPFTANPLGIRSMAELGDAVHDILKSDGFNGILKDFFGLDGLDVRPIAGTWQGKVEPSFDLVHPDLTFDKAKQITQLLTLAFAQDAGITYKPSIDLKEGIQAAYLIHSERLTDDQLKLVFDKAREVGVDVSTTTDGKGIKALNFGTENFADKIKEIQTAASINQVHETLVDSELYETEKIFKGRDSQRILPNWLNATSGGQSLLQRSIDSLLIDYAKAAAAQGYIFDPALYAKRYGLSDSDAKYIIDKLYPTDPLTRSASPLLAGTEILPVRSTYTLAGKRETAVPDMIHALQNRAASDGVILPGDYSPRAMDIISSVVTDEVQQHMARAALNPKAPNAIGWYDAALKRMKGMYSQLFPWLEVGSPKHDADKSLIFDAVLGIASQGNDVFENAKMATRVTLMLEQGKTLPEIVTALHGTFGDKTAAIENNILKLHELLTRHTPSQLRAILFKTDTVANWNKKLKQDTSLYYNGEPLSVKGGKNQMVTGFMIFGPKIGSFINNLHGDYSTLTADLWYTRTWNRILGRSFKYDPLKEGNQFERFEDALIEEYNRNQTLKKGKDYTERVLIKKGEETPYLYGEDAPNLSKKEFHKLLEDSGALLEFAEHLEKVFRTGGFKGKTELRRAAKNWVQDRTTPLAAPRAANERAFQQTTMEDAQAKLARAGINVTIADMQAALWFNEKELFGKYGAATTGAEPADYADAAKFALDIIQAGGLFQVDRKGKTVRLLPGAEEAQLTGVKSPNKGLMKQLMEKEKAVKEAERLRKEAEGEEEEED